MDIASVPRNQGLNAKKLPYISLVIREQRVKLRLSQVKLAKSLGIGLKTLRKIEQGDLNVTYLKLKYLLNALGLDLCATELVNTQPTKKEKILSREFILESLEKIFPILERKYGVSELALFGSYANGTASVESDIDILIDLYKPVSLEIEGEILVILENLLSGKKVDLTLIANIHEMFKKDIEATKINVSKKI